MPARAGDSAWGHWRVFGFNVGNAIAQFPPGKSYAEPNRRLRHKWPELTVEGALGGANSPARRAFENEVSRHGRARKEWIEAQIAEGLREGERFTKRVGLIVGAQKAAEKFRVDADERDALGLRTIGDIETTPEGRREDAEARRRERDRAAKSQKRRKAGCKPRDIYEGESLSRLKPWEAEGISRRTWERRRRDASNGPVHAAASPSPIIRELRSLEIIQADGLASSKTERVTPSARRAEKPSAMTVMGIIPNHGLKPQGPDLARLTAAAAAECEPNDLRQSDHAPDALEKFVERLNIAKAMIPPEWSQTSYSLGAIAA